ncbi:MAG: STAS domain-containing protein [Candidatus Sumerlaeia bacterium]|nr:STAS domain-containing protein [Candidatus Sumerlaeia bacterium]
MSLTVNVVPQPDVTVVSLSGEVTVKTYRQLTEVADALAQQSPPPPKVRLDLAQLNYIDSVGLGSLIKVFTTLKRAGTELVLASVAPAIRDSLALTKLDKLLAIE